MMQIIKVCCRDKRGASIEKRKHRRKAERGKPRRLGMMMELEKKQIQRNLCTARTEYRR